MSTQDWTQEQKVEQFQAGKEFAEIVADRIEATQAIPADVHGCGPVDDLRTFIDVDAYAYDTKFRVTVKPHADEVKFSVSCAEKDQGAFFQNPEAAASFILGMWRFVDSQWEENESADLIKRPRRGVTLPNGATVVHVHHVDEKTAVVLCTRDVDYNPWVTWQFNKQDGGAYHGHYIDDYAEAIQDFADRVEKLDDLYGDDDELPTPVPNHGESRMGLSKM